MAKAKKAAARKAPAGKRHSSVSSKQDTLGKKIDTLYQAREARLAKSRELDALKKAEEAHEQELIALLDKAGLKKASGQHASVSLNPKSVPRVLPDAAGWPVLYGYIKEHDAFDLLQRRLNTTAYRERVEQGVRVPGTESITVVDLSLRAL